MTNLIKGEKMKCNFSINDAYELAKTEMMKDCSMRDKLAEIEEKKEVLRKSVKILEDAISDLTSEEISLTSKKASETYNKHESDCSYCDYINNDYDTDR